VDPQNLQLIPTLSRAVVGYKFYLSETTGSHGFPEEKLDEALGIIAKTGRPASFHCEDQRTIDDLKKRLGDNGRRIPYADLRPPESELAAVMTVVAVLTKERVPANVCHASLGETLSIVEGAKSDGLDLNCEATLHHLYFSRRDLDRNPMLKTNPPLRSEEDREALIQGVRQGKVSFIVTDHAPHAEGEKVEKGAAGVPGLDDFSHVVSWLIRNQEVDPSVISMAASKGPARFLGMKDRGSLAVGMRGDLSILDLRSPEKVEVDSLRTKCGWSPYEGREFPGRARWTIVAGEVLLDDFEFVR
jgi:dihydroorotase